MNIRLGSWSILFILLCLISCQRDEQRISPMVVGSYNIRYANASDSTSGNGWGQRLPVIANLIRYHDFDILGTQEGLSHQLKDLERALPQYYYIGVGRDDGKTSGEHSAIFYKKDSFALLESGNFWLSETPDVPSTGWDAALPRICSWGHFRQTKTGQEFLFLNLHLDHVGSEAREQSVKLVKQQIQKLDRGRGLPIILSGDFNVDQHHIAYQTVLQGDLLFDSYETSDIRYATNGTFNSFDPNGWTESRIDHIFVSPNVRVIRYGILTDSYRTILETEESSRGDHPSEIRVRQSRAKLPSDHYPVRIEIELSR